MREKPDTHTNSTHGAFAILFAQIRSRYVHPLRASCHCDFLTPYLQVMRKKRRFEPIGRPLTASELRILAGGESADSGGEISPSVMVQRCMTKSPLPRSLRGTGAVGACAIRVQGNTSG